MKKIGMALTLAFTAMGMSACCSDCCWDDDDYCGWNDGYHWWYDDGWNDWGWDDGYDPHPPCSGCLPGDDDDPVRPGVPDGNVSCQSDNDCPVSSVCFNHVCVAINDTDDGNTSPCSDGQIYYNDRCYDEDGVCVFDKDCQAGWRCYSGVCIDTSECKVNSDCADDMICTSGRCLPCKTDVCDTSKEVECVFSSQCESGLCVNGSCLAVGGCAIDAHCMEGQICMDNVCIARPECLSDAECGDGRICNASNACEDDVECRQDRDCGDQMICVNNMCAQCRLNCECPEGNICMNGACVQP